MSRGSLAPEYQHDEASKEKKSRIFCLEFMDVSRRVIVLVYLTLPVATAPSRP